MSKKDRGFASMSPAKQRAIASKGGKAAHEKGTAYHWTSETARIAGLKGGAGRHKKPEPAEAIPPHVKTTRGGDVIP